jgi:hypothetical protein
MRQLLLALAVLLPAQGAGADEDNKPDKPKRPAERKKYAFLLPGGILGKLDLSAEQRQQVRKALEGVVDKNRKTLDEAIKDFNKARAAADKARKDEDRTAFKKAQQEIAAVTRRVQKARDALEKDILAILDADQKKKYLALKKAGGRPAPIVLDKKMLAGLKPLTEMGTARYKGYEGGLYPGGKNERPAAHEEAGLALARKVVPLNKEGKPAEGGKVVLLTVGMSNTEQASRAFGRLANSDEDKDPHVVVVNGAQGGMTAAIIQDPTRGRGQEYWDTVDERLEDAGLSRAQVQVVWIKEADAGPSEGFPAYAKKLQGELAKIVQLLPKRFPNVKLVYLSSRTYGGYATTRLNPEPYAFESGYSVKWLIEQQFKGDKALNYDPEKGKVTAPWLSWGPYLWAAGATRRKDGFHYDKEDFGSDGTHPSAAGERKVGELLLKFFKTDSTTKPWFVKND